jgi:cytidylate kinase
MKVVGTIGKYGRSVIVGRGANFILPLETTFRLRVIAPQDFRAQKVSQEYDIPLKEAQRRILKTESDRKAFIRKYFHSDIADPGNYDMIINSATISLREAIDAVAGILKPKT